MEQATSDEEQRVLLDVADRIMRYIDAVSTAVAQPYLDEREQLVSEQERWARALMDGLLDPVTGVGRTGAAVGEDRPRTWRTAIVPSPSRCPARRRASTHVSRYRCGRAGSSRSSRATGSAAWPGPDVTPVSLTRTNAMLALGEPMRRDDLPSELEFVRLQVETARSVGQTGTIAVDDLLLELLLARSPRVAAALRARVLGPLEEYAARRSPELLQTLVVFVQSGLDRRETATRLSVHANTLDHRLRRVEQLTGLRLGDPQDLTLAVLALKQRELAGDRSRSTPP